jgi:cell division protein FtsQ
MRRLIPRLDLRQEPPSAPARRTARRNPRRWSRTTRRASLALGLVLLLIGAPVYAWRAGHIDWGLAQLQDTATSVSADAGYTIQDVVSLGRNETPAEAVLAALGVRRGQPMMEFDPKTAKQRLEALGWVRTATVQRQLPDTVRVHLVERQAMARWQHDGGTVLVDRDGVVIGTEGLERYAALPLIVGPDAPGAAPALFALLITEPALFARITAAVRVGARRWDLHFDNGIAAQLPEDGLTDAWRRLASLAREHALFERAVAVIDLRLADRLTLRLDDGATSNDEDLGPRI